MSRACLLLLIAMSMPLAGCAYFVNRTSPEELDRGLTVILPGVEGRSWWTSNVAEGLRDGGVNTAIEIDDWTTGNALLFPVHLRHISRNRGQAQRLAAKIVAYQDAYPGRPVNVVGISGGGGMTLLTLEALPPERRITSAVLIAPAISPRYDIQSALDRTEQGITSVYSPLDMFVLGVGTTVFGTIDGKHTPSAGMIGFDTSKLSQATDGPRLRQLPYNWRMIATGNLGGHTGSSTRAFARDWVAAKLAPARDNATPGPSEPAERLAIRTNADH
jgi:pimeloyl-ACP methyl ester carboxylesterase